MERGRLLERRDAELTVEHADALAVLRTAAARSRSRRAGECAEVDGS